jgi:siroheme synthase (precorrin-2 oxidase/ferrochelatase)
MRTIDEPSADLSETRWPRCLLVGAGNVALEKIGTLLKTGLRLRVVAPECAA